MSIIYDPKYVSTSYLLQEELLLGVHPPSVGQQWNMEDQKWLRYTDIVIWTWKLHMKA